MPPDTPPERPPRSLERTIPQPELADTVGDVDTRADTQTASASTPARVDPLATVLEELPSQPRYEMRSLLGHGGMGEVRLCRDARIGREVAYKVILPELDEEPVTRARFLREARIQGQLEHPAIVPVHDLGVAPDGSVYFTMKRVRGMTLEQVLAGLAAEDPDVRARYSLRKLLTAFASVCLAVDFAHSRGVVHRDLKPGNVMLGDFGEVYVLDWGLARIIGSDEAEPELVEEALTRGGPQTLEGSILGTPGYLAPEQIRPRLGAIGPRTDVYALGAILFEILTLKPLVVADTAREMVLATVKGVDARASVRAPERDVPPELDAVCLDATAVDPAERLASARGLHDAVERYLEGDRDLERRRELSIEHAREAEQALSKALSGEVPYEDGRGRAMQALARALALDTSNEDAMRTMLRLLTEPPREIPAEVEREVVASGMQSIQMGVKLGAHSLLVWFLFIPLFLWLGVRDVGILMLGLAPVGLAMALSYVEARRAVPRRSMQAVIFVLLCFTFAVASRLVGPFMLVPTLAAVFAVELQAHPGRFERVLAIVLGILAITVPFALEQIGVLAPSYVFHEGTMTVVSHVTHLREGPTLVFLLLANVAILLSPGLFLGQIRVAFVRALRRVHLYAWHLRRLMPG